LAFYKCLTHKVVIFFKPANGKFTLFGAGNTITGSACRGTGVRPRVLGAHAGVWEHMPRTPGAHAGMPERVPGSSGLFQDAEFSGLEFADRIDDLGLCVHNEGAVAGYRFVERLAAKYQ